MYWRAKGWRIFDKWQWWKISDCRIINVYVTDCNWRVDATLRNSVFFSFRSFFSDRSIRFALLNYLIRTHPSEWMSQSLINSIPAFTYTPCRQTVSSAILYFPSCRSLSASVEDASSISFLIACILADRWKSERPSRSRRRFRFWKLHVCANPVQFPDAISRCLVDLKKNISRFPWKFFRIRKYIILIQVAKRKTNIKDLYIPPPPPPRTIRYNLWTCKLQR